jgi:hypothetical protein
MRTLLLPLFLARLGMALLPFLAKAAWLYKSRWLVQTVMILAVGLAALSFVSRSFPPPQPLTTMTTTVEVELPISFETISPEQKQAIPFSLTAVETTREKLEFLSTLQPNHRDLLINQAILEKNTSKKTPTNDYLQAAIELDPNSPLLHK